MRCPAYADLPPPPTDKSGWPWSVEGREATAPSFDSKGLPKISIITPSYNQGRFIEETIRSVLLQGYPDIEYIIIDGGSTDESVAIIQKYAQWLTYWVSEKDDGQAHAIEKGCRQASGVWFNWINSDDLLMPGALTEVASIGINSDIVAGATENFATNSFSEIIQNKNLSARDLICGNAVFHQPSVWLNLSKLAECGGLESQFHYVFDWEMLIRYLAFNRRVTYTKRTLAKFRLHNASKTVSLPLNFEQERRLALSELSYWSASPEVRRYAALRCRQHDWWDQIASISGETRQDRLSSACRLLAAACADPRVRFSRMTLGAIRGILRAAGRSDGG